MIKLISTQDQKLDGSRRLKVDEPFEVSTESIANTLVKMGRARYPEEKKRTYNRRDMKAAS